MIKNLIAFPYEVARRPLVQLDKNLSGRVPPDSGPRRALGRAIGSTDKVAGTVLRNRDIARRGSERLERVEKLATAVRLEKTADTRREQADATIAAGRQEAAEKREDAQEHAASGLQEADVAEARAKQQAKDKAAKAAATKKAAADKRAASRTATAEQRKERAESSAEAKKKAAQRTAKNELEEARQSKQAAQEARADAERLSDLTEAKKQARKQD